MKRNSSTLFLESTGATTPIPWVDNAPDFTGFTEPTLSVLQSSWQSFVDSGEQLEIVADPDNTPIAEPNWIGFNTAMLNDVDWGSWAIPADVRTAIISAAVAELPTQFATAYTIAKSLVPPAAEAVTSWQAIADNYNIPVTF